MMLSDGSLSHRLGLTDAVPAEPWQRIEVDPFRPEMLQPCSIDVHLGSQLRVYAGAMTDTRRDNAPWWERLVLSDRLTPGRAGWILQPDRFYLGVLEQFIRVPEDCCGQLAGVSSRARDSVSLHQQAGLLDPGWAGRATLELTVENPNTVLYPGLRIGQVTFALLDRRCRQPYHGRYLRDTDPQPARLRIRATEEAS